MYHASTMSKWLLLPPFGVKPVKKQYNVVFKIGDKVRIEGSSTIGVIDNIEKNNAVVNYDTFTTKTNISKLEFVK